MASLCRCGKAGRRHYITDACLSPENLEYVRRFAAAYDMADLGPWWHQAAGKQSAPSAPNQLPDTPTR